MKGLRKHINIFILRAFIANLSLFTVLVVISLFPLESGGSFLLFEVLHFARCAFEKYFSTEKFFSYSPRFTGLLTVLLILPVAMPCTFYSHLHSKKADWNPSSIWKTSCYVDASQPPVCCCLSVPHAGVKHRRRLKVNGGLQIAFPKCKTCNMRSKLCLQHLSFSKCFLVI